MNQKPSFKFPSTHMCGPGETPFPRFYARKGPHFARLHSLIIFLTHLYRTQQGLPIPVPKTHRSQQWRHNQVATIARPHQWPHNRVPHDKSPRWFRNQVATKVPPRPHNYEASIDKLRRLHHRVVFHAKRKRGLPKQVATLHRLPRRRHKLVATGAKTRRHIIRILRLRRANLIPSHCARPDRKSGNSTTWARRRHIR